MLNKSSETLTYCYSYPKSGRTWLRFILANYFNNLYDFYPEINYNNIFTIFPNTGDDPLRGRCAYAFKNDQRIPLTLFDHSHYQDQFNESNIIFLIRGIPDTLVSNYFQEKNRLGIFNGDIKSYLRIPDGALARLTSYLNNWSSKLDAKQHLILSYESMHMDTFNSVRNIIQKLTNSCNEDALYKAIELSNFNNMKKSEIQHGFPNPNLKFDLSDNNALRAREGKVENYHKYLDSDDVNFVNEFCETNLTKSSKTLLKASIV